ncbi:hypothetical protein FQN54_001822 [Arachnomyces sp. PD_36]|nr:hypothetical protein FQN54_001822 [Arachnomyces sp. PD_36]
MAETGDWMGDLERQRLELEENVSSLQKSLYHWRLWEAEYDGLREEIAELKEQSTREDLLRIGKEFGGTLVNEEEVKKLLGEPAGVTRSRQQVVDLISRRIDYVKENVRVFEKRLSTAEDKLNALLASEESVVMKEDELPVTEIMEELDDDDRVISSSTTTPNEAAPMIMDVLKKAGVEPPSRAGRAIEHSSESADSQSRVTEVGEAEAPTPEPKGEIASAPAQETSEPEPPKKIEQPVPPSSHDSMASISNVPSRGSSNRDLAIDSTLSNEDSDEDEPPVLEVNESPEDAALRQEMLQYGLNEVGAVVAELDLDEEGSEFSVDDEDDYEYMEDETEDEDEDEYGRTTRRVLDDDYRKQMLELEKKLNAQSLQNIGPDPSSLPVEVREELEKPSAMKTDASEKAGQKTTKKKKVAFADDLDIAPEPAPKPTPAAKAKDPEIPEVPAIQDTVMERVELSKPPPQAEAIPPKRKVSRFKSSRNSGVPVNPETPAAPEPPKPHPSFSNTTPTSLPLFPAKSSEPKPFSQPIQDPSSTITQPPHPTFREGQTLADNILEREPSPGNIAAPDPDGLDENLHRQEIATEYYKLRNRKIQQSGGFVEEEEGEQVPIEEPVRKVSRFKAARAK